MKDEKVNINFTDFEVTPDYHPPWTNFRFFKSNKIESKLQSICSFLGECGVLDVVGNLLLDFFVNDDEHRKEVTLILNNVLLGKYIKICE